MLKTLWRKWFRRYTDRRYGPYDPMIRDYTKALGVEQEEQ